MKLKVYTIFDTVAEEYATPFFSINDAVASRSFRSSMSGADPVCRPDYQLYRIADYDTETGEIVPAEMTLIPVEMEILNHEDK